MSFCRLNPIHRRKRESFFVRIICCMTIVILAIVIGPAVLAQNVATANGNNFSFSTHKRYAWRENRLMTRQRPDTNELMDLKIVKKVNEMLSGKGFEEVKDKPDFYIFYDGGGDMDLHAGGQQQANSTSINSTDRTPTYGLGNGPAMAPATWLKVNGQITFHMTDAASGKPIWETTYKKTFRDPDKAIRNWDKESDELVKKSFKDFPPKNKT